MGKRPSSKPESAPEAAPAAPPPTPGKGPVLVRRLPDAPPGFSEAEMTPMPDLAPGETVVLTTPIRAPYSCVRVVRNEETTAHRYEVVEPPLTPSEARTLAFAKDTFVRTVDVDLDVLDDVGARAYLLDALDRLLRRHRITLTPLERARIEYYLERDFLGFGPIDVVMHDADIEDISCDGPGVPLFVYHRRHGSVRTNIVIPTEDALDGFVMQLVQRSGKHISVAEPLVDATLPDGSRLQASLSREVTTRGSTFTIRKFREDPFTPPDLVRFETASAEMMAYFWLAVEFGASGIICGGTASGKTTTLNALSLFIPRDRKIVSIEDTREMNLPHENWIPGITRAGGAHDAGDKRVGAVDMFDLLRAALRQRPEYIVLGEIRGAEAYVLFQAMATGHTVYSTMHADSVASAVYRLESKPIEVPRMMLSGLDFVAVQTQVRVGERRFRKIRDVVELTGIDPRTGELLTNRVFQWDPATNRFTYSGSSVVLSTVAEELNKKPDELAREFDRRRRLLDGMTRHGLRDLAAVGRLLEMYATDPDRAMAEVGAAEATVPGR